MMGLVLAVVLFLLLSIMFGRLTDPEDRSNDQPNS